MLLRLMSVAAVSWGLVNGAYAARTVVRDVSYAPMNGKFGLGDLYLPDTVDFNTRIVLLIHGGGWTNLDRESVRGIAEFLWEKHGCAVYNIEYRLAHKGENRWPACGDDCVKAANWIFRRISVGMQDFRRRKYTSAAVQPEGILRFGRL